MCSTYPVRNSTTRRGWLGAQAFETSKSSIFVNEAILFVSSTEDLHGDGRYLSQQKKSSREWWVFGQVLITVCFKLKSVNPVPQGKNCLFMQAYGQIASAPNARYRLTSQPFQVYLKGEGATDAGNDSSSQYMRIECNYFLTIVDIPQRWTFQRVDAVDCVRDTVFCAPSLCSNPQRRSQRRSWQR